MRPPLLQASEIASQARLCVPVTLRAAAHEARWTAVLILCVSRGFHAVACSTPRPLSSKPSDIEARYRAS